MYDYTSLNMCDQLACHNSFKGDYEQYTACTSWACVWVAKTWDNKQTLAMHTRSGQLTSIMLIMIIHLSYLCFKNFAI